MTGTVSTGPGPTVAAPRATPKTTPKPAFTHGLSPVVRGPSSRPGPVSNAVSNGKTVPQPQSRTRPAPAPATRKPLGIEERLDELKHLGGCQTRIHWSPTGTLAAIAPDSQSVGLYHFWADPSDRVWKLSSRIPLAVKSRSDTQTPVKPPRFCHVQWNELGQVLALIDRSGQIRLFSMPSLSRGHLIMANIHKIAKPIRPPDVRTRPVHLPHLPTTLPDVDTDPVVLIHWLPVMPTNAKTTVLWGGVHTATGAGPGSGDDAGEWKYDFFTQRVVGPASPFESMGSFIAVHRSGRVRLVYQASVHDWMESTAFLGSPRLGSNATPGPLLVHAAVAPRNPPDSDPHFIIAAFDGRLIRIFRVQIKWPSKVLTDLTKIDDDDVATLQTKCLLTVPFPSRHADGFELTHLEMLSPAPHSPTDDDGRADDAFLVLVAAFHGVGPTGADLSIVSTWDVVFPDQDSGTAEKPGLPTQCSLRSRAIHRAGSPLLSISRPRFDTVLALCYADGAIQFRDRQLCLLEPDRSPETVRMLSDVGFAYPPVRSASDLVCHIGLSPNACVAASLSRTGDLTLRRMDYFFGDLGSRCIETDGGIVAASSGDARPIRIPTAVAAALALTHSRACAQQRFADDVLAVMAPADESLKREFSRQALLTVMLTLDYTGSDSPERLRAMLWVPVLFKIVGAHYTLQLGPDGIRSAEAKVAWVILNLKTVMSGLTTMGQPPGPMRPGLAGLIRYVLDLISYIFADVEAMTRELVPEIRTERRPGQGPGPGSGPAGSASAEPGSTPNKAPFDSLEEIQKVIRQRRSAGLLLLLSSVTRGLLISAVRTIRTAYGLLLRTAQDPSSSSSPGQNTAIWRVLADIFSSFPINLQTSALSELLSQIDSGVQSCYNAQPTVDRAVAERELNLSGVISPVFLPVVRRLLASDLPKFMATSVVDRTKLYALDLSSLGLSEDNRTRSMVSEGAVLASLPATLCRRLDRGDRDRRDGEIRMRQRYPGPVAVSDAYLKWQSTGGPGPNIPNFPLWATTSPASELTEPRPSCWTDCSAVPESMGRRVRVDAASSSASASTSTSRPPLPLSLPLRQPTDPGPMSAPLITESNSAGPVPGSAPVPLTANPDLGSFSLKRKRSTPGPIGAADAVSDRASSSSSSSQPQLVESQSRQSRFQVPLLIRPNRHGPIDVLLKQPIKLPAPMRRCIRCGSLSEDLFWVSSSSAREAVAKDAAGVYNSAAAAVATAQAGSDPIPTTAMTQGSPDPAIFFVPPRVVAKHLMFEQGWMTHASRSCVCTGEWAKIV